MQQEAFFFAQVPEFVRDYKTIFAGFFFSGDLPAFGVHTPHEFPLTEQCTHLLQSRHARHDAEPVQRPPASVVAGAKSHIASDRPSYRRAGVCVVWFDGGGDLDGGGVEMITARKLHW